MRIFLFIVSTLFFSVCSAIAIYSSHDFGMLTTIVKTIVPLTFGVAASIWILKLKKDSDND